MMNRDQGVSLNGIDHLKQSIRDILTTPIGSRVMRRDYGSRLFELIDTPINGATIIDFYAATAEALDKWEPRLKLTRVQLDDSNDKGLLSLTLEGEYLPLGKAVVLEGITL